MRNMGVDELERLRMHQEEVMQDTCVLMRYSETFDAMHHPVPAWTDGPMLACGLRQTAGQEVSADGRVLVSWPATLRLPIGTRIDLRDRVRIVLRFGQACTPMVYGFAEPAQEGPSGLVIRLKNTDPRVG